VCALEHVPPSFHCLICRLTEKLERRQVVAFELSDALFEFVVLVCEFLFLASALLLLEDFEPTVPSNI
jgi:hypothetical protein